MSMNTLFNLLAIALALFIAYDVFIVRAFEGKKDTKTNTFNSIIAANSRKYKLMVMHTAIIDEVYNNIMADPFWNDAINN